MDKAQLGMLLVATGVAYLLTMWKIHRRRRWRFVTIRRRSTGQTQTLWMRDPY